MNDTGHHATFSAWLKGDIRNDDWKSDWRKDFERRSAEDKGKYVSAPQIHLTKNSRRSLELAA